MKQKLDTNKADLERAARMPKEDQVYYKREAMSILKEEDDKRRISEAERLKNASR